MTETDILKLTIRVMETELAIMQMRVDIATDRTATRQRWNKTLKEHQ